MKFIKNRSLLAILFFAVVVTGFGVGSYVMNPTPGGGHFTEFGYKARGLSNVDSEYSENEDYVYNYLRNSGYSVAATCAIMGNVRTENSVYDAEISGYGGVTYGLFQWTDSGNRKENMIQWCNQHMVLYTHMDGQLEYMMAEIAGEDSIACRLQECIANETDPVLIAEEFAAGFERCVGASGTGTDGIYQGSVYPEFVGQVYQGLERRKEYAQEYYDVYSALDEMK